MGKKKYKSSSTWGGWGNDFSWGNYSSAFESYTGMFASSEEKREFKTTMQEKALEALAPVDTRVNNQPTTFMKRRKMVVNINQKDLSKYNKPKTMDKIIEGYDKIPYNSDIIDDDILKVHLGVKNEIERFSKGADKSTLEDAVKDYFNGTKTYKEVRSMMRQPSRKECEEFAPSGGGYSGFGRVGNYVETPKTKYEEIMKLLRAKIQMRDIVTNEANLRKGKKINRGFINQTSYKPLVSKSVDAPKKKKLMIIQDCSGSMSDPASPGRAAYEAVSFAGACVNSGVFEVDHVIYHSSSGWENVAPRLKKGELFGYRGGAEGFEVIDDNLDQAYLDGVDYILVLTDLCIGHDAEQGIYNYVKSRKHMILSFDRPGELNGLNVRQIKTHRDMVNALGTLVS